MFKILVICAIFAIPSILADRADFKKTAKECIKELGVKTDDKGRPDKEDAEKKCLAKCIGLKLGVMDEQGAMVEAKVPEKMRAAVKGCFDKTKETDVCKKANEVFKCVKDMKKGKKRE